MSDEKSHIADDEFKLAITMAGAASAGCYTGGVMDYIFEVLDLWERAKADVNNPGSGNDRKVPELKGFENYIPRHRVTIDALGGTSAGGMTATIAAIYALNGGIKPVKKPGTVKENKHNLFYDSWVLMDDMDSSDTRDTFQKLWDTDDLKDGLVRSVLNSKFIDAIADRSFVYKKELLTQVNSLPSWISKDLQIILSHCLLRGIPLDVDFETPIAKTGRKSVLPNHTTYEHYIVSHYHLNKGIPPEASQYLWLNQYDEKAASTLKLATKATGAFPVGLAYREFTDENIGNDFLRNSIKRIIKGELGNPIPDPGDTIKLKYLAKDFSSLTVDGGAINNEPYREVNSLLKDKYGTLSEGAYPQFGVVMIDPFPDRAQTAGAYQRPDDLLGVVPGIIGALTDQSRIKRREILENDSLDSFRSIIFPRKWKKEVDDETGKEKIRPYSSPIACSTAMAFGGLLDINFRQHDFFLGRNNARNFLRFYFSFPYDKEKGIVHPIHKGWSQEMIETFLIEKEVDDEMQYFLPIIPDLNLLLSKKTARTIDPYTYDIPGFPKYDPARLFALRPVMKKRFLHILKLFSERGDVIGKLIKGRKEKELAAVRSEISEIKTEIADLGSNNSDGNNEKRLKRLQKKLEEELEKENLIVTALDDKEPVTNAGKWMQKNYGQSLIPRVIFSPLKNLATGIIFRIAKPAIANMITKLAIEKILTDLDENDCLLPYIKKNKKKKTAHARL